MKDMGIAMDWTNEGYKKMNKHYSCNNTRLKNCMDCGKYSINECHGYKEKPTEEIIVCRWGGFKKWKYIDGEFVEVQEDE